MSLVGAGTVGELDRTLLDLPDRRSQTVSTPLADIPAAASQPGRSRAPTAHVEPATQALNHYSKGAVISFLHRYVAAPTSAAGARRDRRGRVASRGDQA